ncbi:MAG: protein kinase [Clostridium sp.]|nr:protein kinase [Clostridium sp.]
MRDTYNRYIKKFDVNLLRCLVLGRGHNGIVYLLPDGKVAKVCFTEDSCRGEYYILNKVNGNKYFPRVYGMCGNYMVRDYVGGECLRNYIKKYGFNEKLGVKLISMLREFDKLKFRKKDIRCKDIFVEPDGNIRIIDPKKNFSKDRDFPRHLCKGLYKLGVLDEFMDILKREMPENYKNWHDKIYEYLETIDE